MKGATVEHESYNTYVLFRSSVNHPLLKAGVSQELKMKTVRAEILSNDFVNPDSE